MISLPHDLFMEFDRTLFTDRWDAYCGITGEGLHGLVVPIDFP